MQLVQMPRITEMRVEADKQQVRLIFNFSSFGLAAKFCEFIMQQATNGHLHLEIDLPSGHGEKDQNLSQ